MAQRIQILCDMHLEKDEEVSGAPLTFGMALAGAKLSTYEVDLCEVCSKEVMDILSQFTELGRQSAGPKVRRAAAPKAAAPRGQALSAPALTAGQKGQKQHALATGTCPLEGCDYVAAQTKSAETSLRRHLREVHNTNLDAALGLPTPFVCPECHEGFGRPQGLALHRTRMHQG